MICLSSELFPIILKIAWLRCLWSYSFIKLCLCCSIPSFPERKGWITLVCSQLDVFFNYHFLIACVHLIHWLITMGSVWSLDLVYVVFPIHGQILWSCGGKKALVIWVFFFTFMDLKDIQTIFYQTSSSILMERWSEISL